MTYSIKLIWNGTTGLDRKCTAVCGYDTAHAFIAGNFAGPTHRAYLESMSGSLGALLSCGMIDWTFEQGGIARAIVCKL